MASSLHSRSMRIQLQEELALLVSYRSPVMFLLEDGRSCYVHLPLEEDLKTWKDSEKRQKNVWLLGEECYSSMNISPGLRRMNIR